MNSYLLFKSLHLIAVISWMSGLLYLPRIFVYHVENIENLDWVLSYQSRVGPLKWIGPSTENIIVENSQLGKHIVLVPIAFVSEHSETLVELDIEYKELADKNGCKNYTRVPALGTNENYIKALSNLIINKQDYNFNGELFPPKIQCPNEFIKCPCLNYE